MQSSRDLVRIALDWAGGGSVRHCYPDVNLTVLLALGGVVGSGNLDEPTQLEVWIGNLPATSYPRLRHVAWEGS